MSIISLEQLFGKQINTINTLDQLDDYAVHNFSGQHSASNIVNAQIIVSYIKDFLRVESHCDIGGGNGQLSKLFLENGIKSYTIDGSDYGIRNNVILIPKDKYAVFDFTSEKIQGEELKKVFDITTAFEVTEHIPEEKINLFYENCQYISKKHLCSVHWGGDCNANNPNHNHYNIKPKEWWIEFLSKFGDVSEVLLPLNNFSESSVLEVEFKN